jgi:uncharacterized protein
MTLIFRRLLKIPSVIVLFACLIGNTYAVDEQKSAVRNTSSAADAPSFDCKKASSSVEKTICGDPQLIELDAKLAFNYNKLRGDSSENLSKWIVSAQRGWLKERNNCPRQGVRDCLVQSYTSRLEALKWAEELSAQGDINGDGISDLVVLTRSTVNASKVFAIYSGSKSGPYKKEFESSSLVPIPEENQFHPLEAIEINDKGVLSLYFEMAYTMGSWMRETHTYRIRLENGRFRVIGHDYLSHYRNQNSSYAESWNFLSRRMLEEKVSEDEELFQKKYSFELIREIYLDDIEDALAGGISIKPINQTLISKSGNHPTEVELVGEIGVNSEPSKDWKRKNLYGSDNEYAALRKVELRKDAGDKWTVLIQNQFSFLCTIHFDGVGTPALLKNCSSRLTTDDFVPSGGWKATPPEIPLICTARSKEIVCNGKYSLNGEPAVMTIARKK